MIGQRRAISVFLDEAVNTAVSLFLTPMATADPDVPATHMVADIERWMAEDRGSGGRGEDPTTIRYSVLALLVAFYLLIRQAQKVSLAGALQVLLFELTPDQRQRLGMTADLAGTRAETILLADDPDASTADQLAGRQARSREYARLAKFSSAVFAAIDPSVFYKADTLTQSERKEVHADARVARQRGEKRPTTNRRSRTKMTNKMRKAILADPQHPDRRIDEATSQRNHQRLLDTMNKVVAAAAKEAPMGDWAGDLATDETIVITLPRRYGHGTREDLLISSDPDAYYWRGKASDDDATQAEGDDIGFGYGITFLVRVGRPYERRIPEVALGIHIGRPTGGRTEPVRAAHVRAERHGLMRDKRQRRLIADRGYTKLDDWLPFLHEHRYQPVQDYPKSWSNDIDIADIDEKGDPALAGPHLIAGQIRCPGATGLTEEQLITPHNETTGPETPEAILDRHRRVTFLDALAMPVKDGLRPLKTSRGRPKRTPDAEESWAVSVQCPAALGLVNCRLVERQDGLRNPEVPDVPNPPRASHPSLLPRACRQNHVTYQLPVSHAKRLQPFTWGSHQWADAYSPIRSANERYHSQFKHRNSGGVTEAWIEMRGIAKAGLLFAIATAVTTEHLIGDFRTKHVQPDGTATFGPREELRRRRQQLLRQEDA